MGVGRRCVGTAERGRVALRGLLDGLWRDAVLGRCITTIGAARIEVPNENALADLWRL